MTAGDALELRHTLATLAYRAAKVLRGFPEAAAGRRLSASTRSPLELLSHLGDLMEWGERLARGEYRWEAAQDSAWAPARERFLRALSALDAALAALPPDRPTADRIFQGPIADALTHVGQLALLRNLAGVPIRPESYARAEITPGRVGLDQAPAQREFDGDASHPSRTSPRPEGDR